VRKFVFAILLATVAVTPAAAEKKPQVSGLELQQIQARDMETTIDVAFPAVMTVLQDAGYRIQSADKSTGLIVAEGSSNKVMTYNILYGFGQKKRVPTVSAFIESRGPQFTRVRLSFVMSLRKSRNAFSDEDPITDPAVYRQAFEQIEKEIFTRNAMNATVPAVAATPTGASATVTPAAQPDAAAPAAASPPAEAPAQPH
jgi:hypothetical protein